MNRHAQQLSAALLVLIVSGMGLTGPAHAVDLAYYTYGTFEPFRDTLVLVQGFLNDTEFDNWVFVFAVVGLVATAVMGVLSSNGDSATLIRKLVMTLFVAGLVLGLVNTNGNLNVYDPVLNETETVPVSNIVVLTAGSINSFERSLVDVFDSLSIAGTHAWEDEAGFVSWRLLYNAAREARPVGDPYLFETIKSYYIECVAFVSTVSGSGLTVQSLKKGGASTDLKGEFAKAGTWESVFSTVYTSADKSGTPQTCKNAWSGQTYSIKERLEATGAFDSFFDEICARSGYNVNSSAQLARCKSRADVLIPNLIGVTGNASVLAQNAAIAAAMASVAFDEDVDLAVTSEINRGILGDGINNQIAWGEWGQLFRGVALTISLLAVPVMLLFLFTPLAGSVLRALIGLFAFNALWGILDVGAFHIVNLVFQNALEELRNSHLGYDTFMTAPGLMTKTLAAYGIARVGVVILASFVAVQIFRLPAYAFAQIGNAYGSKLDHGADKANELATNPAARSEFNNRLNAGLGEIAARHGVSPQEYDRSMAQTAMGSARSSVNAFQTTEAFAHRKGMGYSEFREAEGAVGAGRSAGQTEAFGESVGSYKGHTLFEGSREPAFTQSTMDQAKWRSFNRSMQGKGFTAGEAGHLQGLMMQHATMGDAVKDEQLQSLATRNMANNPGMSPEEAHMKASDDWHMASTMSSLAGAGLLMTAGEDRIARAAHYDAARRLGETEGAAEQVYDMHALGRTAGAEAAARTMGQSDAYGGDFGRYRGDVETDTKVSSARAAGKRQAANDLGGIDVFRIEKAASYADMAQSMGHLMAWDGKMASEIADLMKTEKGIQVARAAVINDLAEKAWLKGQDQDNFNYGSLDAVRADFVRGAGGSDMDITFDGRLGGALMHAGVISEDMYNSLNGRGEIRLSVGEAGTTANVFGRSGDETDVRDGVVRHSTGMSADDTAVVSRFIDPSNDNAREELRSLAAGILNNDARTQAEFARLYTAAATLGGQSGSFTNQSSLEASQELRESVSASTRVGIPFVAEGEGSISYNGGLRKSGTVSANTHQDRYAAQAYAYMAELRGTYGTGDERGMIDEMQNTLRELSDASIGFARQRTEK